MRFKTLNVREFTAAALTQAEYQHSIALLTKAKEFADAFKDAAPESKLVLVDAMLSRLQDWKTKQQDFVTALQDVNAFLDYTAKEWKDTKDAL